MEQHRSASRTATVEEAGAALGISRTLAYELARADKLPVPVIRLGRRLVIPRAALDRLLSGEAGRGVGAGEAA